MSGAVRAGSPPLQQPPCCPPARTLTTLLHTSSTTHSQPLTHALPALFAACRRRLPRAAAGRLNVLANVMRKPMEAVFSEFAGRKPVKGGGEGGDTYMGSGDVKYHLGTSYDRPTISGGWGGGGGRGWFVWFGNDPGDCVWAARVAPRLLTIPANVLPPLLMCSLPCLHPPSLQASASTCPCWPTPPTWRQSTPCAWARWAPRLPGCAAVG